MNGPSARSRFHRWWRHRAVVTSGCMILLFAGLVIDLLSDQELVVAIIYNIPIVVSALLVSRRLTIATVVLSLAANVAAGYDNAIASGGADAYTIANRVLAGLSFLLVGAMTLLFEHRSDVARRLAAHEEDGERERELRHLLVDLSGPHGPDDVMSDAAEGLRQLFRADCVVIVGLDGDRFTHPRWAAPAHASVADTGSLASWAVDALPATDNPVITSRDDHGLTAVGLIRGGGAHVERTAGDSAVHEGDLVVVVSRPDRSRSAALLSEALAAIERLRWRAIELDRLRQREVGRNVVSSD